MMGQIAKNRHQLVWLDYSIVDSKKPNGLAASIKPTHTPRYNE